MTVKPIISQDRPPPIREPSVTTVKRRSRKERKKKSFKGEDSEVDLAEIEKELDRFKEVLERTYA